MNDPQYNNIKNDLLELFKDGQEKLFFRDTITDDNTSDILRFKTDESDNIICYILTEFMPSNDAELKQINLHYDEMYNGSDKLNNLMEKYKLELEWENSCIAYLFKDDLRTIY